MRNYKHKTLRFSFPLSPKASFFVFGFLYWTFLILHILYWFGLFVSVYKLVFSDPLILVDRASDTLRFSTALSLLWLSIFTPVWVSSKVLFRIIELKAKQAKFRTLQAKRLHVYRFLYYFIEIFNFFLWTIIFFCIILLFAKTMPLYAYFSAVIDYGIAHVAFFKKLYIWIPIKRDVEYVSIGFFCFITTSVLGWFKAWFVVPLTYPILDPYYRRDNEFWETLLERFALPKLLYIYNQFFRLPYWKFVYFLLTERKTTTKKKEK